MNNNRVIGLDLFRIVMMFGICLIHTCGQGEYRSVILHNMTTPCVVGFAMLSGYFGLQFSISKVVRLYSMAVAYCFLIPLVGNGFSVISGEGYFDAVLKAWGAPWRYWYLHAYIALLCISPALRTDKFGIKQPFVLVVFIWGFMLSYRTFSSIVPKAAGFGSHTFVTLLGIYIVSRIAKERLWFERMTVPVAAIGIAVAMVVLSLIPASGNYNSLVALLFMFSLFSLFKRIKSLGWGNKIVILIAPSMFGVYLLHCAIYYPGISDECYGLINHLMNAHVKGGWSPFFVYFLVAFEVFVISLAIDLLRRSILFPMRNLIRIVLDKVDACYERIEK